MMIVYSLLYNRLMTIFIQQKGRKYSRKTLVTYVEHFRFFTNWLEITDYNLKSVNDLSGKLYGLILTICEKNITILKQEKRGLSIQTINARIRFLKTWYSFLKKRT